MMEDKTPQPQFTAQWKDVITNQQQMKIAELVYVDLCEAKGWWNVHAHCCPSVNLVFLSGHPNRHTEREIVLPLPSDHEMSQRIVHNYFSEIKIGDKETNSIILAISDTDFTVVYYKISNHLVPPENPELTEQRKTQSWERSRKRKADMDSAVQQYCHRQTDKAERSKVSSEENEKT